MVDIALEKQTINKDLLQKRFRCAAKTYDTHALVQKNMAKALVDMAQKVIPNNQKRVLELGCGTGLLTREVLSRFTCENYMANDLVTEVEEGLSAILNGKVTNFSFKAEDAEAMDFPDRLDVVWSGATIQWIDDLDTFFKRLGAALNIEGKVVMSSFDIDNYKEVKAITGKGIDYKTMEQVLAFASKYFTVLDCKSWRQQLWFQSPRDVLKHMRFTGVNAVSNTKWGKADLERFNVDYEMFRQEKGYPLTYHPFVFVLQKKK